MFSNSSLSDRTKIGVFADEPAVNGFKLTGINGSDWTSQSAHGVFHYFHVVTEDSDEKDIISKFRILAERKEIAIIFLGRKASNILKEELENRQEMFPIVMEIPSKNMEVSDQEKKLMKRLKETIGCAK